MLQSSACRDLSLCTGWRLQHRFTWNSEYLITWFISLSLWYKLLYCLWIILSTLIIYIYIYIYVWRTRQWVLWELFRLASLLRKMEIYILYKTVKKWTPNTKMEFFQLLQNILMMFIRHTKWEEKKLYNAPFFAYCHCAKKHTQTFCYRMLSQVVFRHCEPKGSP